MRKYLKPQSSLAANGTSPGKGKGDTVAKQKGNSSAGSSPQKAKAEDSRPKSAGKKAAKQQQQQQAPHLQVGNLNNIDEVD